VETIKNYARFFFAATFFFGAAFLAFFFAAIKFYFDYL
jgi:hypothetical protein